MMGGWSQIEIEPRHTQLVEQIKPHINTSLGAQHQTFTIIEVRHQIVAGTNYQFILKNENDKKITVKVFEPLPHTNQPPQVTLAQYMD